MMSNRTHRIRPSSARDRAITAEHESSGLGACVNCAAPNPPKSHSGVDGKASRNDPSAALFEISHNLAGPDESVLLVQVPRELNHESAEPLRAAVMRGLPNRDGAGVVLDMEAVGMVSSIGIAALLQIQEFCRDRRAGLVLARVPQRQLAFLKMLKLDRKFAIEPSTDAALTRLAGGPA